MTKKWFHAIGASGKATANICKMFKDMGWFVTGTDTQFLPPASNIITENDIPFEEGYHFSHLNKEFWEEKTGNKLNDISDHPDLCLIVESASDKNKEYLYAKRLGIPVKPYSEILGEYLIKEKSIVVVGTAGKTTTTSLLTKILTDFNLDPSYMIGAEVIDFEDSLKNTDSEWSVIEGDEYHSLTLSKGPKFMEYKPRFLLITSIGYEHQDVFPTQEDYLKAFNNLVKIVPEEGVIVARGGYEKIDRVLEGAKAKIIRYGDSNDYEWWYRNEDDSKSEYKIMKGNSEILRFNTNLLGNYNLENITAAVALILNIPAADLPIDLIRLGTENIKTMAGTIKSFKGPRKRLEILHRSVDFIVVDDFGVAPDRAKNSLATLHENFPEYEITAIFEPNSASRTGGDAQIKSMYKDVFNHTTKVIIPDLSEFNAELITQAQLANNLRELGFNVDEIAAEDLLKALPTEKKDKKQLIVFFSSYRLDTKAHEYAERLTKNFS